MTKFLKLAKINGHKILNGLRMNLDQAVKAFCIVNNKKFEKINILMKKNG
jgi:Shikimate 5-dehydrogenase